MLGDNLLRFNKNQKYAVIDCETCHLNLAWEENVPWQRAIVEATKDEIISTESTYVNWDVINIPPEVAFKTHYSEEKVRTLGIKPIEALKKINKYIYNPEYKIIMHNGLNFDIFIHNIHQNLLGVKTDYSYLPRFYDSNSYAKAIKMNYKPSPDETPIHFQYKFVNYFKRGMKTNMTALGKEYGIDFDEESLHNAENDVKLNYEIFKKQIYQMEI